MREGGRFYAHLLRDNEEETGGHMTIEHKRVFMPCFFCIFSTVSQSAKKLKKQKKKLDFTLYIVYLNDHVRFFLHCWIQQRGLMYFVRRKEGIMRKLKLP